jgi:hypothetical protein
MEGMGQPRDHHVQAQQTRGGTLDGLSRPLSRRFEAQMGRLASNKDSLMPCRIA